MLTAGASHAVNILIVDDDVEMTVMLSEYLRTEGFQVKVVFDGEEGVACAVSGDFAAVILDVMLPKLSGVDALRRIRQRSEVPVIMLTAKGDSIDRVVGLELGADDYVPKPYFPPELVARLRAVLRRQPGRQAKPSTEFFIGGLHVDVEANRVQCAGRQVELTSSEFKILTALLRAGDAVVSKESLSQQVLARPLGAYDRSIDVHVSNLRQKIGRCGARLRIEAVRTVGYRIVESQ